MSSISLGADECRIALVIGQQAYVDEKFVKLKYCLRDIEEVEFTLTVSCGFKVIPYRNATHSDRHNDFQTLQKLLVQAIQPARRVLVLVYYAGHAVSIAGQSYFIPVDAKQGDVSKYINVYNFLQPLHDLICTVNQSRAQRTAEKMTAEPVPGAVVLLILDGCRDAPPKAATGLPAKEPSPVGSEGGQAESATMSQIDMQDMVHKLASSRLKGTNSQFCVFFACDDGSCARECETSEHGFLTEAFLHCIDACPGIGLRELFEKMALRCQLRTNCMQRPWIYDCCHSLSCVVLHQPWPKSGSSDPAMSKEAIERSCPDAALKLLLDMLKSCVGNIKGITKAGEVLDPEELQTQIKLVQDVVARLLQQEGLRQEAMSVAVDLLRGLQCLLPNHRAVPALMTRVRACAWQEAARRLFGGTPVASDVQRGIDEGKDLLHQMSVTVVVVGPTSSGKSTMVNALFGRKVCPMGNTPTSLLPVAFTANASIASFQVIPRGHGLRDCLVHQLEGKELHNLTSDEAHALIDSCDETLRKLISDSQLCPENLSDFASWHIEVLVAQREEGLAVLQVSKPDSLAPFSDRNKALAFFGGSFPNKDVFLIITKVEGFAERTKAEEWLDQNTPSLRDMQVKRQYFINAGALLAYQICQERGWKLLPQHASTDFEQNIEEVKLCVKPVLQTLDVRDDVEDYKSERQNVWRKLNTLHNRTWSDNSIFKDELEKHVCRTWPDLFCGKVRSFVLDALRNPIVRLRQAMQEAELEQQAANAAKHGAQEFLLQNPWCSQAQQLCSEVRELVLDRINFFCDLVDEGPTDWFDHGHRNVHWNTIEQIADADVAAACRKCNHHASSRSHTQGMRFDTITDAKPFLTSFGRWVCQLTHTELDKVYELLHNAFEQLRAHGVHLPMTRARPGAHDSSLMHVPDGALQSVAPTDRVLPVASVAGAAAGSSAALGAVATIAATAFVGAPAAILTVAYRVDKFGERFVNDALYGWFKQLSGNDFVNICGEHLRNVAEEEVSKEIQKTENEVLRELERAKNALNSAAGERVRDAEASLQEAANMLESTTRAQESLSLVRV
ncbi:unnamed protein product [Symbiodinium sp. CCMP2592]|nr:unnamed protein product [Symbiodinium sp. CCMP2592]